MNTFTKTSQINLMSYYNVNQMKVESWEWLIHLKHQWKFSDECSTWPIIFFPDFIWNLRSKEGNHYILDSLCYSSQSQEKIWWRASFEICIICAFWGHTVSASMGGVSASMGGWEEHWGILPQVPLTPSRLWTVDSPIPINRVSYVLWGWLVW